MLLRAIVLVALVGILTAFVGAKDGEADGRGHARADGWSRLPDPPFVRTGGVRVWTGRGLLLWGGEAPSGSFPADGAFYDARLRRWRPLPPAPIAGRAASAVAWTGSELLVWGGWAGSRLLGDGAAFDPATGAWRRLPPAPLSARIPAASVWTGSELLVWGDASRSRSARDGAAYDPERDRWRRLPPAPLALNQASAAWVAARMVVYGAHLDGREPLEDAAGAGDRLHPRGRPVARGRRLPALAAGILGRRRRRQGSRLGLRARRRPLRPAGGPVDAAAAAPARAERVLSVEHLGPRARDRLVLRTGSALPPFDAALAPASAPAARRLRRRSRRGRLDGAVSRRSAGPGRRRALGLQALARELPPPPDVSR